MCRMPLEDATPEYSHVDETRTDSDRNGKMRLVTTKVGGYKRCVHRVCINSWWESVGLHLNTCPMNHALCYGIERKGQTAVNLPEYTGFIGHNLHTQRYFRPLSFSQWLLASYPHSNMGNDGLEELDSDEDDTDSIAMPGREMEVVQAPFAKDPDPIEVLEGLVETVADGLSCQHDRPVRNDVQLRVLHEADYRLIAFHPLL